MKFFISIFIILFFIGFVSSCGDSEYNESTDVEVLSLPKADCGGNPCL